MIIMFSFNSILRFNFEIIFIVKLRLERLWDNSLFSSFVFFVIWIVRSLVLWKVHRHWLRSGSINGDLVLWFESGNNFDFLTEFNGDHWALLFHTDFDGLTLHAFDHGHAVIHCQLQLLASRHHKIFKSAFDNNLGLLTVEEIESHSWIDFSCWEHDSLIPIVWNFPSFEA